MPLCIAECAKPLAAWNLETVAISWENSRVSPPEMCSPVSKPQIFVVGPTFSRSFLIRMAISNFFPL